MAVREANFDVVSGANMEEVKNAIQVALEELKNRFGFKGSIIDTKLENDKLVVVTKDDYKTEQVKDILFGKLVKHGVPTKDIHFLEGEKALGDTVRQYGDLISGIDKENAKKINTAIEDSGVRVKSQVQEDKTRVTGKSRDGLQKVMALLQELGLPMTLKFNNYR